MKVCPGPPLQRRVPKSQSLLQPSVFAIVSFHTFAKTTAPLPHRQNHAVRPSASRNNLVTVLGELLPDLGVDGCALLGVDELLLESPLALVVGGALDLSPLLEPEKTVSIQAARNHQYHVQNVLVNDVAVLPAELTAETADGAVLAAGLEAEDTEGLGDDHALLVVVGRGDTLEGLQAVHGSVTTLGLVRDHATDGAPEHLGRRTVVPWTTARGVETGLLAEEGLVLHCVRSRVSIGVDSSFLPPRSVRACAFGVCVCV